MYAGKPIHVVDDDFGFLKGIERLLVAHDLQVKTFVSAEEFRSQADPNEAACLILDIHLGSISGIELMRELSGHGAVIPVILITASDNECVRQAALTAGCSDFLQKPFSAVVLMDAISKAVRTGGSMSS